VAVARQVVTIIPTAKTISAPVAGSARAEASCENPVQAVITPTVSSPTPAITREPAESAAGTTAQGEPDPEVEQGEPVGEVEPCAEPFSIERMESATR
jgi:hypothetical protein